MYLHEIYASQDGYSDNTLLAILARCKKYKVSTLLIESNFGDGMVSELFRKHAINKNVPINIEETRANVRKEDRIIDSLEPVFNQHRLVIDHLQAWMDDPRSEANHLALGMDLNQRQQARGKASGKPVPTWI